MEGPGYVPLKADRFASFQRTIIFNGIDLTGRFMQAQVRASANAPGVPLANLPLVTDPSLSGLRLTQVATAVDGSKTSYISLFIQRSVIEAMPALAGLTGAELTDNVDLVFAWDFQLRNVMGIDDVTLYGPFILRQGVTQP